MYPTREASFVTPIGRWTNEIGTVLCGGTSLWAVATLEDRIRLMVGGIAAFGTLLCGAGTLLNAWNHAQARRERRRPRR